MEPGARGLARIELSTMSPGERQFYLLLASRGSAALVEEEGKRYYVIDEDAQQCLVDPLSARPLPLRDSPKPAAQRSQMRKPGRGPRGV